MRDKLVLLLVAGVAPDSAKAAAGDELGLNPKEADAAIEAAQQAIVLAADVDRRRELGVAVHRLNSLYTQSVEMADTKVALSAQRELNRLLELSRLPDTNAPNTGEEPTSSPEADQLAAVAGHLLPLQLAPADYPVQEHARIAADAIRRAGAQS